jgi:hypothetical protein
MASEISPAHGLDMRIERSTSAETQRGDGCEPAEGWHIEEWPGVRKVAVPAIPA